MSTKEQLIDQVLNDIENCDYKDHEDNFIDCVFVSDANCNDSSTSDDKESSSEEESSSDD